MKKPRKRLDRPSFWKWAILTVLGLVTLAILRMSIVRLVGGNDIVPIVVTAGAGALARLVVIALLAMALARRFRDIGWPAWIGPTILLVTQLSQPFLVAGYASMTYAYGVTFAYDIREWGSMVRWISDSVSVVLLIVVGSMPGKTARAENIEVARVFD